MSIFGRESATGRTIHRSSLIELYNLKNLNRYNLTLRIRHETVAEHSYFTTLLVMLICDELKVDNDVKLRAMQYSIIHDLPEILISDIPHPVKSMNSSLDSILKELEIESLNELAPEYTELFMDIDKKSKLIVEIADVLSVLQYCISEEMLGNKCIQNIYDDANRRLMSLNRTLYKYFNLHINVI